MKVELSKAEVIEAVREATVANVFINGAGQPDSTPIAQCRVCAAGAVFRRCLNPETFEADADAQLDRIVEGGSYSAGEVHGSLVQLRAKRWLNAISVEYETAYDAEADALREEGELNEDHADEFFTNAVARRAAIERVIDLVETFFPPAITVDIDGLEPREGAKVVT